MAQPAMQAFRIEKQLSDLRWGFGRSAKPLNAGQRTAIRTMLNDADQITKDGKLSFEKIYKSLDKQGLMPSERRQFAMDRVGREELLVPMVGRRNSSDRKITMKVGWVAGLQPLNLVPDGPIHPQFWS